MIKILNKIKNFKQKRLNNLGLLLRLSFIVVCLTGSMNIGSINAKVEVNHLQENNLVDTLLSSQGQVHLNATISFNQTAYLPNSFINVTLSLQNNFTQALTDISFDSIFNTDLNFTSGSLHNNFSSLGVNETASASIEFKLPENAITPSSLDVVFLIDGSGSMGDEIAEIKAKVLDLISQLIEDVTEIRIGFIFFGSNRFSQNPYNNINNILDFTSDEEEIQEFINPWGASGGDEPWGDALRYMDNLDWQGSVRLAILITDEPSNNNIYITSDPQLYSLAGNLAEEGIIISTLECIGADTTTTNQLTEISDISGGVYISLTDSETSLIDEAIYMVREAIKEYGIKIETNFTASLDGTGEIILSSYKWVLIDNKPPSLSPSSNAIFQPGEQTFLYRINCIVYDPSPVGNVTLFYKFDSGIYQETLMDKSSHGLFTFLLPYLDEGTVVTYYLNSSDALNNSITTDEYNFTVDFEIPTLDLNRFRDISLAQGEMMILKINITDTADYALLFHSTGNISVSFTATDSPTNSQDLILEDDVIFGIMNLLDYTGYGILILTTNYETVELISLEVILCNILDFTMGSTKQITISNENPVYLYKVNIDNTTNTNFYSQINATNEFQEFKMMVFTENLLIKFHYFHKISVSTGTSGVYYVLILLKDTRPEPISVSVEINYGEIDDDPYFPESPDVAMAISGFPSLVIHGFLLISVIWLIFRNRRKFISKSV